MAATTAYFCFFNILFMLCHVMHKLGLILSQILNLVVDCAESCDKFL